MKKTKMKVLMAALLLVVLPLAVFANGQQDDGVVKIGAAMSSFSDKGQTYLQDGVRDFDEAMEDVEILMTDGKDDPAQQLNQIETLLIKGVDAILLVPVDISAMGPIVDKCKEAGVKLVVANRLPGEEFHNDFDVYAGSESILAGIMQAEWVAEAMQPEGGKVGIIMGPLGQEAARMRTEGNKQVFAEYDNIEVVIEAEGKWDRAKGMQIAENWIQSGRDLDAIVCNNDEMAIGALLAAQGANVPDEDLIIAGVDATPDAIEYLGEGLDATIKQDMYMQGYNGAKSAYLAVKGDDIEKWDWIPYVLVTIENKADFQ